MENKTQIEILRELIDNDVDKIMRKRIKAATSKGYADKLFPSELRYLEYRLNFVKEYLLKKLDELKKEG